MMLAPWISQQFFDSAGQPAVRYRLFTYLAGTTTKTPTYVDNAGSGTNTNPIELDYRGECRMWLNPSLTYKFVFAAPGIDDPPTNPIKTVDNVPGWVDQATFNTLYWGTDDHKITSAEIAAGVTPTNYSYPPGDVRRYGAVPGSLGGAADATSAFQQAISAGYSPTGPSGYYGISTTLVLNAPNQAIRCLQGDMTLVKYSNTPVVSLLGSTGVGLFGVSVVGNYTGSFTPPVRPSGAPSFTDTTDNITIGVTGVDAPFFWQMDQVRSYWAGRDNIHHFDGPGGLIGGAQVYYAARWNYKADQIVSLPGGAAVDTAHTTAKYIEGVAGGLGTYTEGGNFYLQGATHSQWNCKSFAAYGDGFRLNTFGASVTVFSELDGAANTLITTWASGQVGITVGTMRRYLKNCYVATTAGTTGATPPTWTTGTASDGGVTWQYRSGRGLYSESNGKNQNIINLIFCNGVHQVQSTDQLIMGDSSDGASVEPTQTRLVTKRARISRSPDFGDFDYTGDYGYIDFVAPQGLIATFGAITAGSGYTNGTYLDVPLTGGNGSNARANITVAGAVVTVCTLVNGGQNFLVGDVLGVAAASVGGTGSGFSIPVATLQTANRQYDLQHNAEGSGLPVDWYLGRNGSAGTNEALRLRSDGHAILGDICHGGRVIDGITSAGFSMFGRSAAYGDIFFCDATAGAVAFNIYDGGQGSLAGRRLIIVKVDASANPVTVNGLGSYNGTAFGSFNVATQWAYTELILRDPSTNAWWKKV